MADPNSPEEKAKAALEKAVKQLGSAPELNDTPDQPGQASTPAEKSSADQEGAPDPTAEPVSQAEDDAKTEKAVDDIMKMDGDDALKAQDDVAEEAEAAVIMKNTPWERFKNWNAAWWASPKKRWSTIAVLALLVGGVFAWPFTRYNVLGLALRSSVTVTVLDSKSGAPVSGAKVELSGATAESQADGKATFKANMGTGKLAVSKKYYTGYSASQLVQSGSNKFTAQLVATGRQVQIKLVNKITGKPVGGATVTASGAKAKTNTKGLADLVLPSGVATQKAEITLGGYSKAEALVVADGNLAKNTFTIVPSGKMYFLSNLSGKIDVVKTNLDGSDRKTVLAGTGNEDKNSTSLLASRDWKYLALLSRRAGENASIYLIDTTNGDKLSTVDEGNADFSFAGWSGDRLIYKVQRNTISIWQANREAVKSFDPESGHTLLLDQTQATGTDQNNYASQTLSTPYLIDDQVVYAKSWSAVGGQQLDDKQGELIAIGADGAGHKVVKTFPYVSATNAYYRTISINTSLYEPDGLYISTNNNGENVKYYEYDGGKVSEDDDMTNEKFYSNGYPTFLLSPSGDKTFWADSRDGKYVLSTGDADAKTPKQVKSLSDYNAYGWYTDEYLLVSKGSSELYIMSKDGGTPLKITDYYKPAITYQGYGGGYGGQ